VFKTVEYKDGKVRLIDQTRLPLEEVYVECDNYQDVARAIKIMQVRGAPAIGVTAAMGVALGAKGIITKDFAEFYKEFVKICNYLAGTRPTAVNLFWAIVRMKSITDKNRDKPVEFIKDAHEKDKKIKVYADETRPFLQGARLTAWELVKEGIPVRLITDNMAGYFMGKGEIDKVIVGADRIAANGDTANKIGTYSLSILAKE